MNNKTILIILILVVVIIILPILCIGVIFLISILFGLFSVGSYSQNTLPVAPLVDNFPATIAPSSVLEISEIPQSSAYISGKLSYPSEYIPAMKVCAEDITDLSLKCVNTAEDQLYYALELSPGSYYVFAEFMDEKIYYTKCDETMEMQEQLQCNNPDWHNAGFNCSSDPACKSAFAPKLIVLKSADSLTNINIIQNWYNPE